MPIFNTALHLYIIKALKKLSLIHNIYFVNLAELHSRLNPLNLFYRDSLPLSNLLKSL